MKLLICLMVAFRSFGVAASSIGSPTMIGGELLDGKQAPFAGTLYIGNRGKCTGTIVRFADRIDKRPIHKEFRQSEGSFWVMTAAHCVVQSNPRVVGCTDDGALLSPQFPTRKFTWNQLRVKQADPKQVVFSRVGEELYFQADKVLVHADYRACTTGDVAMVRFKNSSVHGKDPSKVGKRIDIAKSSALAPNQSICIERNKGVPKLSVFGTSLYAPSDKEWLAAARNAHDKLVNFFDNDVVWSKNKSVQDLKVALSRNPDVFRIAKGAKSLWVSFKDILSRLKNVNRKLKTMQLALPVLIIQRDRALFNYNQMSRVTTSIEARSNQYRLAFRLGQNVRALKREIEIAKRQLEMQGAFKRVIEVTESALEQMNAELGLKGKKVARYTVADPHKQLRRATASAKRGSYKLAVELDPKTGYRKGLVVPGDSGGGALMQSSMGPAVVGVVSHFAAKREDPKLGYALTAQSYSSLADVCYVQLYSEALGPDLFHETEKNGLIVNPDRAHGGLVVPVTEGY